MATDDTGGYDCHWIEDPPDDVKCQVCLLVARDPQQHGNGGCGKVFCQTCINYCLSDLCPNCREQLTVLNTFEDVKSARHINGLKVKCSNIGNGCEWLDELGSLEDHLETCDYTLLPCKYSEVGCKETRKRKEMKTHEEDDQLHLRITTETVLKQSRKMAGLANAISTLMRLSPFKFKVTNYHKKKRYNKLIAFHSPLFYSSINGYNMSISVYANGQCSGEGSHVSVFACLMKGNNDDSLNWPFTGEVVIELLNQLEDKNHHTSTTTFPGDDVVSKRVVDGERGSGWGPPKYIHHTKLDHDPANNCQYLKDDTLIFRVTVKVPDHKPWLECAV